MAAAMEQANIEVQCDLNPLQFACLAVDLNCSREAYHALQSNCLKSDTLEMDFDKLAAFMKLFFEEKYCKQTCGWKMEGMQQWDEALQEVYVKHFQ